MHLVHACLQPGSNKPAASLPAGSTWRRMGTPCGMLSIWTCPTARPCTGAGAPWGPEKLTLMLTASAWLSSGVALG